jgi:hypothetical protein
VTHQNVLLWIQTCEGKGYHYYHVPSCFLLRHIDIESPLVLVSPWWRPEMQFNRSGFELIKRRLFAPAIIKIIKMHLFLLAPRGAMRTTDEQVRVLFPNTSTRTATLSHVVTHGDVARFQFQ